MPLVCSKYEPDELSKTHCTKLNGHSGMGMSRQKNTEKMPPPPPAVTTRSLDQSKGKQSHSSNLLLCGNGDSIHSSGVHRSKKNTRVTKIPRLPSHPMRLRDRTPVPAPIQTQSKSKNKRPVPKKSSYTAQPREPKVEPYTISSPKKQKTENHALISPKDEPITEDMHCSKVPVVTAHIDSSNVGDSVSGSMFGEDCTPETPELQSVKEINTADGNATLCESRSNVDLETSRCECSSSLEIASSPSGEMKISLSYKLAPGRSDFHIPSHEVVLNAVEDKFIRSQKTLDPNILMMDLMNEMCEYFLELGTDSNRQSVIINATKSSGADDRSAKASGISLSNGLIGSRSGASLPQSKSGAIFPPLNSINGGPQLNKLDAEDEIVINRETQGKCAEEIDGPSLMGVQNPQLTCPIFRSNPDVVDIARGQEKIVITLVNEVNDERPPSFCYILLANRSRYLRKWIEIRGEEEHEAWDDFL